MSNEDWETPLGIARNDMKLSSLIVENSGIATFDNTAHMREHSVEVQLPFLQHISNTMAYVFICMGEQDLETSRDLANAIEAAARFSSREVIVVASSDFNHYEDAEVGREKDYKLIERLEALDYEGFNRLIGELDSSVCGYGPITVAAKYAKDNGAKEGRLLSFSNSGFSTGDMSSVVDYASLLFM